MTNAGKNLLTALKRVAGLPGPQLKLAVQGFEAWSLRPVPTVRNRQLPPDVTRLTTWRNRFAGAFLTEFQATQEGTAGWLGDFVHRDDGRILFMVEDGAQRCIGYMGIACIDWDQSYGEADAVVKGEADAPEGLMSAALITMLSWARGQLGLETIAVRVLSDNPALRFYRGIGFEETKRVPLRRIASNDLVTWVEDNSLSSAERYLVHHIWRQGTSALDLGR